MTQDHYARIASFYDAFVQTNYDVPFFLQEAEQAQGSILELMAGTGRLTLPLVRAGFDLTCIDFSGEMLAILHDKLNDEGLSATVQQMDVRQLDLQRQFAQIIIPFQAFPELTDEADQRQALAGIAEHLAPDGTFICTLHNPVVRLRYVDNHLHLAGQFPTENGQLFVWLLQKHNPAENTVDVLEFFEEYDENGLMQAKRHSALSFHLLEKDYFAQLIDEAGFAVEALYGNYDYSPFDAEQSPFMIWKLRHKG